MIDNLGDAYKKEVNARQLQQLTAGEQSLKDKLRQQLGEIDQRSRNFKNARKAVTPRCDKLRSKNIFTFDSENDSDTGEGITDERVG